MNIEQLHNNRLRIGQRIAELRKEKGLTQIELADCSQLTQRHISRIESGRYNLTVDLLAKVAEGLGCKIDISSSSTSQ